MPESFVFNEDSAADHDVVSVEIGKAPLTYSVNVNVSNSVFHNKLAGVEISLFDSTGDSLISSGVSDNNGLVHFDNLPYGHTYHLEISNVPFGYENDNNNYDVVLPDGYAFNSPIILNLDVVPKKFTVAIDADNSVYHDVAVKGVEYVLFDDENNVITQGITDESGHLEFTVDFNKGYFVSESANVFGYEEDNNIYDIKLNDDFDFESDSINLLIHKVPLLGRFSVDVRNSHFDIPVDGVKLGLFDAVDDEIVSEAITSEGNVIFEDVPYGHDYYVELIEDVFGYYHDENHYDAVIPSDYDFESNINVDIELDPYEFEVHVHCFNNIYSDVNLEGVEYSVFDQDDTFYIKDESNNLGIAEFNVFFGKEYKIKETENIFGYEADEEEHNAVLTGNFDFANNAILIIEVGKNPLRYDLQINTENSVFGDKLSGVEYSLYDRSMSNRFVGKSVTEDGIATFHNLPYGHEYYVVQSATIFGYKPDAKQYGFEVDGDFLFEDPIVIDINAVPYDFKVVISAINAVYDDVPVMGEVYTAIDENGGVHGNAVTNGSGKGEITLTYGRKYHINESALPLGYVQDTKSYSVVIPAGFNFTKNTVNMTIRPEPVWYNVPVYTKDDNGHPVKGVI